MKGNGNIIRKMVKVILYIQMVIVGCGNWKNNKKNGFGMFRDKTSKETIFGIWENDILKKQINY